VVNTSQEEERKKNFFYVPYTIEPARKKKRSRREGEKNIILETLKIRLRQERAKKSRKGKLRKTQQKCSGKKKSSDRK
jgi:hypothetical protein